MSNISLSNSGVNNIFNMDVEAVENSLKREEEPKMGTIYFQDIPTDLYVPMISPLSPSLPIERLSLNNKDARNALRNWIQVAGTSKWMFKQVMQKFYEHPIFTSLVSDVRTEREDSCSLFQALRPTVNCVKAMTDHKKSLKKTGTNFFDVLWRVDWSVGKLGRDANIVASIPHVLFEMFVKRRLFESTIFVCREEYRKKDNGHDLSECINAFNKLTIGDSLIDETQILKAVKYTPENFFNLPGPFQDKQEYMLAAADDYWVRNGALRGTTRKFDREFVLEIVGKDGLLLKEFPYFKHDKEIVLTALLQAGLALEYAGEEFKKDPTFVLVAVQQNGLALEYASPELQNDPKIVQAAQY